MYTVKLPPLSWFVNRNTYSGSFRTDDRQGCVSQTTFNYKVRLAEQKGQKRLVAMCYFDLPWNGFANMDEAFLGHFEASDFGLSVCQNWIRSKFITDPPPMLSRSSPPGLCTEMGAQLLI